MWGFWSFARYRFLQNMEEFDLNTANAKQKVKIFKGVIKEVKSKEMDVKLGALARFRSDCRFFSEGGAFAPFLETIAIKKVTMKLFLNFCCMLTFLFMIHVSRKHWITPNLLWNV